MALYRDAAVVLRTHKLGEADRIVVLFTRDHGKVRAVAKGVRRTSSRHGVRLEPMAHVRVQLYRGRDLDTVTQAECIDAFPATRADLDRLARAALMLEVIDGVVPEREPDERLHAVLVGALRALDRRNGPLVVAGFLFRVLEAEGVAPVVDRCVACGGEEDLTAFDPESGGARCRSCRAGMSLPPEGFELARLMLGGRMGAALNAPPSAATEALERVAVAAIERHLERRLRAPTVHL